MVRKKRCDKAVFPAERGVLGILVKRWALASLQGERRKGGGGRGPWAGAGVSDLTVKVRVGEEGQEAVPSCLASQVRSAPSPQLC